MFNMEMYYVDGFNYSVNEDSPLYVHTYNSYNMH